LFSLASIAPRATALEPEPLRVMTFNLWGGGDSGQQPLTQSINVIKAAEADIVGLQETAGRARDGVEPDNARAIAIALKWYYVNQADGKGIISRHKILSVTPKKLGVQIELPSGRRVWVFNVHLMHEPYQPYQLLNIPYGDAPFIKTAEEAVRAARVVHGAEAAELLREIARVSSGKTAIFVTGDFNEPSCFDWTEAVRSAGRCPVACEWPTTAALRDVGVVDAYRQVHPDPLTAPGYTWTPTTAEDDPKDRHDRIDFVLVGGSGAVVTGARVIGEDKQHADLVVSPYPSDHRAVVATVTLK
jgi:endonuclease/exonuclease/phosphatase family metal-dependent hydrolase